MYEFCGSLAHNAANNHRDALQHFFNFSHISLYLCHNLVEKERRRGKVGRLEVLQMKKFLILSVSVAALALVGCGKKEEAAAPAAPKVEAPAAPAAEAPKAAEPAAAAPAADAMAAAPAMDASVSTMIDQLKSTAAAMTAEQKTAAVAQVRTAAEAAAKAAGKAEADMKMAGDAAEAAIKTALGM